MDGKLYSRMDFPADSSGELRSVIHTPEELVVFDPATNSVQYRTIPEQIPDDSTDIRTLFSRVNLTEIKNYLAKQSYRIIEYPEEKLLKIETPSEYLMDAVEGSARLVSEAIYFDTELEVPVGSDYVIIDENSTKISTEETTFYQLVNDVPVQTGELIVREVDFPYTIDTSDRQIPILNSADEAQPVSETELAALEESGAIVFKEDTVLGDPADPDYTETINVQYENIELNMVPDSYFRIGY